MDFTIQENSKKYEELSDELITNNTSSVSSYLNEIAKFPVLTPEEEQELAKIINTDEQAKKTFINCNLRLVVSIAKKFQTEKFELLDLIQEGNLGLLKAVEMFDYTKGFKFSTYATWWIRQAILRAFANKGETIKIPANIKKLINQYQTIQNNFYTINRRYATDYEIAEEMKITIYQVKDIRSYMYNTISLNLPISFDDDAEIGDFIPDVNSNPEAAVVENSQTEMLEFLIENSNLKEREKIVIKLRYDFKNHKINSLEVVAKKLGITRERIRQIESRALKKLRTSALRKFSDYFI